ncbi:MAG: head GIN domain-containing protein [Pyrinomonadaceae bacterium]
MKKIGIIVFAAALVVGLVVSNIFSFGRVTDRLFNFSIDFSGEKGSGRMASELRDLRGFKAVDVGGVFEVEITAGKDFEVEVEADDNLLPLIRTEVNNGVLEIESDGRISPTGKLYVRISAPDINDLSISGAVNVTLNDIKNSSLSVDSSGASKIKIAGETAKFTVDTSGAAKVDAENLRAIDACIDGSGASHIDVNVSGELNADLSGASKVVYSGTPSTINKKTSGAGKVSQK